MVESCTAMNCATRTVSVRVSVRRSVSRFVIHCVRRTVSRVTTADATSPAMESRRVFAVRAFNCSSALPFAISAWSRW
jgi:hypothetical protein